MTRNSKHSGMPNFSIAAVRSSDRMFPYAHGGYIVSAGDAPRVVRPNKIAAGMQFTNNRPGRRGYSSEALSLMVRGTLDRLSTGLLYATSKGKCPCCGNQIPKLKINAIGLRRLDKLRDRAAMRKATS